MKRYVLPVVIVIAAFFVMNLMGGMKKPPLRRPPQEFIRTIDAKEIAYGRVIPVIEASGRVRSRETVSLTPEVSGIVLDSRFVLRAGTSFTRGQVLLAIDDRQALFTYRSTIADLQNAFTSLLPELKTDIPEAYERWADFFAELTENSLPALPQTDTQREKLYVTRYGIIKLYYAAKNQQVALSKHTITAPFTGSVTESFIVPASMARAGVDVATLVRTDEMEIECALPASAAQLVKPGTHAQLSIQGMLDTIPTTVALVSDAMDERMQTVSTFVRLKNAERLGVMTGAYASVRFDGVPFTRAVKIPRKALHRGSYVYVIEDGFLQEKEVTLAFVGISEAYISNGIGDGAILIVEPVQDAVIGMKVQTPQQAAARQAQMMGQGSGKQKPKKK
jgi:RND family efflux transporter MFP subunit